MLLMSLRCYINCVVPTTEKQILLNSRYFVLDIADGRYDSGDFYYDTNNGALGRYKQNNNYRVTYLGVMNPAPHTSDVQYISTPGGPCIQNKRNGYLKHLMNIDTQTRIYNDIFNNKQNDSEYPTMLIMFDEHFIIDYGHLIARYISDTFGVDVEFLDPTLRPNVPGNRDGFYPGNKINGTRTIERCAKHKLLNDIRIMLDETSKEGTISNVTSILSCYSVPEMIKLYNTIYPDKPLSEGYYTAEDMMNIIIRSITRDMTFKANVDDEYLKNVSKYEQELTDWEQLQEDFRYEMMQDAMNSGGD